MNTLSAPHDTPAQSPHLLKNIFLYALIGLTIGVICELVFSAATSTNYVPGVPAFLAQFDNQNLAVLVERIASAALGIILGLAGRIFDVEAWSLAKATALHYLVVLLSVGACALTLRWIPLGWPALGFLVSLTIAYMVIWLSMWVTYYARFKRASEQLAARPQAPRAI